MPVVQFLFVQLFEKTLRNGIVIGMPLFEKDWTM